MANHTNIQKNKYLSIYESIVTSGRKVLIIFDHYYKSLDSSAIIIIFINLIVEFSQAYGKIHSFFINKEF